MNVASSALFAVPDQITQIEALVHERQRVPVVMPLEGTDDDAAHQKVLRSMGVSQRRVVARAQRITARIDIAARGLGICLAPLSVAQKDVQEGRISRVGNYISHAYRYCFLNERPNGEAVKKVREFLIDLIS